MANSNTEHSKKLRAKTASEWAKKQMNEGHIRQIAMKINAELADEFDELCAKMDSSRPQTLKALIDFYNQHHQ